MTFYTNYPNRKDWRRPYRDSRAVDASCRSHGSCDWCVGNRTRTRRRGEQSAREAIEEFSDMVKFQDVDDRRRKRFDTERFLDGAAEEEAAALRTLADMVVLRNEGSTTHEFEYHGYRWKCLVGVVEKLPEGKAATE